MVPQLDQNPIQVLGLIRKPGEYKLPTDRDLRVLDALALAGGLSLARRRQNLCDSGAFQIILMHKLSR